MKPFLKWVGGKTQIIDTLMDSFPDTIVNYHEPFLGGGSVLLAVLESKRITGTVYASDINKTLIQVYRDIQVDPKRFTKGVQEVVNDFKKLYTDEEREAFYYEIRTMFNSDETPEQMKSILFLFLNKTCFRGVYREGPNGFNVPYGHNKNPEVINAKHILEVSLLIKNVVFTHCSFKEALVRVASLGDFVYLDPPYAPVNITSFVGYNVKGFTGDNHQQLFKTCKQLPSKWVMSNAHVPLVVQEFEVDYPITVISCKRKINSKNPESLANEVLVSNL